MIPIFSMALANSSGSTVPLLLRSKYLKALSKTVSSLVAPVDFWESFFFNSPSKLRTNKEVSQDEGTARVSAESEVTVHEGDGRPSGDAPDGSVDTATG